MRLEGWGRYPKADCLVVKPRTLAALGNALNGPLIARGMGRSYGDSSMQPVCTVDMRGFNRMLSFDETTGLLEVESGVTLEDILEIFVPRGWFPPVTPGTKHVTVGGMIASDVHGKNHHNAGSFCQHIMSMDIMTDKDKIQSCSATEKPDLFHATCGGMGLTGVIIKVSFKLKKIPGAYIRQETIVANNLNGMLKAFDEASGSTYSVAWIDSLARGGQLGRGLLYKGEHDGAINSFSIPQKKTFAIPFDMPGFLMNRLVIKILNTLYFWRGKTKPRLSSVDYDTYFYPLDKIRDWNRLYGPNGFLQYQCVVPQETAHESLTKILNEIGSSGCGSFLSVLKLFGEENKNNLSFPIKGYTLALDFPASPAALTLLERLDAIVIEYKGRVYLTKDARMKAETFSAIYPDIDLFRQIRDKYSVTGRFKSLQSERLDI